MMPNSDIHAISEELAREKRKVAQLVEERRHRDLIQEKIPQIALGGLIAAIASVAIFNFIAIVKSSVHSHPASPFAATETECLSKVAPAQAWNILQPRIHIAPGVLCHLSKDDSRIDCKRDLDYVERVNMKEVSAHRVWVGPGITCREINGGSFECNHLKE